MVTVSIVTYHTPVEELEKSLYSLQSGLIDRIYIVDNGEERRIREWAEGKDRLLYIPAPNPGFGAGHNIAIRKALETGTKYHLVLNSDVYFNPEVVGKIYNYMEDHPEVGTLQPKIINPDGTLQYTCRKLPTPIDVFARRFLPDFMFKKRNERYLLKYLDPDIPHNIPYHQGSFMFLRAEALRQCGLFDERFFMYPEDIDLTRRIHRRWATLYYPDVSVTHDHRAESYHSLRMVRIHAFNMIKYFNKWGWFIDRKRRRYNKEIK